MGGKNSCGSGKKKSIATMGKNSGFCMAESLKTFSLKVQFQMIFSIYACKVLNNDSSEWLL